MTVRINKQKINLREKLTEFEDKVNFDEVVRGLGEYTGNVGIGITNPDAKLSIGGESAPAIKFISTHSDLADGKITINEAGSVSIDADASNNSTQYETNFRITVDGNEHMRIKANGYVGIGTTNPNKKLYVNGPIRSTSSINYEDKEILLPGGSGAVAELFVIEADSHYMVTVTRGDTPSQVTICMVTTDTSLSGVAADVHIHEVINSGHYSIIYETASQSISWKNDTVSNPPKINASVLKLK